MPMQNMPTKADADRLYEQYGRPLEQQHRGEYVAISPAGKTILGRSRLETAKLAKEQFGPGSFLFKVGPRAVGRWR
jgi:hypothetical protein